MKGLIQRVSQASVSVDNQIVGHIDRGLLLLLGVEREDNQQSAEKLADKVLKYRVFSDEQGKMNLNIHQVQGQLLVVSQFTLVADTSKGNRPGFSRGATPEQGETLYQHFVTYCRERGTLCETGQFGADMQVSLINDGPVTFMLQSQP